MASDRIPGKSRFRQFPVHCLLATLFLMNCTQRDKPFITAFLLKSIDEADTTYYREVYIYDINGFSMIPIASINDTDLPITDFSYHWYFYSEEKRFALGRAYKLRVKHGLGEAAGKVYVPSDFQILVPAANFILHKDSNLFCLWQQASKASWYLFLLYLHYYYIDSNGQTKFFRFTSDTMVFDTVLVFQSSQLFPSDVRRITGGEGVIDIWAVDGSTILPGSKANIKGAGQGFYNGVNYSGERHFRIANPGPRTLFRSKEAKERLIKKLRRE